MKVEVELPELPEGYEYTGEYRKPEMGEEYLDEMIVTKSSTPFHCDSHPIVRKLEQERPEYKAFLIEWKECGPVVAQSLSSHTGVEVVVDLGAKVGDYRIYGYGDEDEPWSGCLRPCDAEHNYKYAYGRLEK